MMGRLYPETLFKVALIEPEIPNNTGNIGRTCVGMWSQLQLVGPLGFSIDEKQVRRAGLDYWEHLDLRYFATKEDWLTSIGDDDRVFLIETSGEKTIFDWNFRVGDTFVFGKETTGLPDSILRRFPDRICKIPFPGKVRSFNLSNCVAMVLGEALRQIRVTGQGSHVDSRQPSV